MLMNKSIDFARKGKHLSILSVTCTEKVEGYIYVEAFKEIHVKEAIAGLATILGNKCMLVGKEEMPGIYANDKQNINLAKYQWVRVKQGLYGGDLGLVEETEDNKVWLRLIPRLDISKDQQKGTAPDKAKNKFTSFRPPQKIFNPKSVPGNMLEVKTIDHLGN
jgi:transcription elongation factor SPT5